MARRTAAAKVLFAGHTMTAGYEYTAAALAGCADVVRCHRDEVDSVVQEADVIVPLMTAMTKEVWGGFVTCDWRSKMMAGIGCWKCPPPPLHSGCLLLASAN